jgi:hypothetical protein
MRATEVGGYDEQEKFLHSSFVSTLSAFIWWCTVTWAHF